MATKIEWATETWNPITGCTPISEACTNCYAERMSRRLAGRYGYPKDDPFRVTVHRDKIEKPLRWRKPRRVFVVSMGDLFHEDVPIHITAAILGIAALCPNHTFLFLTKRPSRMSTFFTYYHEGDYRRNLNWWINEACLKISANMALGVRLRLQDPVFPLPNIWLGCTVENQKRADERIPILLQIPAAVRFVSVEPMLEPMELNTVPCSCYAGYGPPHPDCEDEHGPKLDWVICGAETGPGARYMDQSWPRDLLAQCKAAGIPFFMKAMSNKEPIPDDLAIREYPYEQTQ